MPWDIYIQGVLGFLFFLLSFGKRVKQIALMEIEHDLKSGKKTAGHQAWLRRNMPMFYRVLGALLMACALLQYLIASKAI